MKNALLLSVVFSLLSACSAPTPPTALSSNAGVTPAEKVSFTTANALVQKHCSACHNASVSQGGVNFSTAAQIKQFSNRIRARAVNTQSMPPGNKTGMTDAERKQLGEWIAQGASIE
jgi:uncharacterized membrane protein